MNPARRGIAVPGSVLAVFVLAALTARWIAPFDPAASGDLVADQLQAPSAAHWLGTDAASRDVFSRMLYGTQVSLGIAALSVAVVIVVGVTWGVIAGLAPGWIDRWMMRFVDALMATPRLLVVLACVAFSGRLGATALALLLGLTAWPSMSRIVRARVRELDATDYVAAARALGTPGFSIAFRHILPGVIPAATVTAMLTVASVIPLEAGLSYFGAGIAPPAASWGVLLQDASVRPIEAWWLLLFPSAAIATTVMCVYLIGERLRPGDRSFLAP
jgi:peptide/nickel transport system permease protein